MALNSDAPQRVFYSKNIAFKIDVPGTTAAVGIPCTYFTGFVENLPAVRVGLFYGTRNPDVVVQQTRTATTAGTLTAWGHVNGRIYQEDFKVQHKITNLSTATVRLKAWLCECRRDQGRRDVTGTPDTSVYDYPIQILGNGFWNAGIGAGVGVANAATGWPNYTPFNSQDFVKVYKIISTDNRKLEPGMNHTYRLHDPRDLRVYPEEMQMMVTAADVWQDIDTRTIGLHYAHMAGERFWLFRAEWEDIGEQEEKENEEFVMPTGELAVQTQFVYSHRADQDQSFYNVAYEHASIGYQTWVAQVVEVINPKTEEKNRVEIL